MKISEQEINELSEDHISTLRISCIAGHIIDAKKSSYVQGFKAAIQKLQPEWIPIEPRTSELSQRLSSTDARLIQCLFDNGEILAFNDDHPFAVMTHYCFLPEPHKQ